MAETMEIKVSELRRICNEMMDQMETCGVYEVTFDMDYYWNISVIDQDLDRNPQEPEVCIGSVDDDLKSVKKMMEAGDGYDTLDMERLGNILVAVSWELCERGIPFLPDWDDEDEKG